MEMETLFAKLTQFTKDGDAFLHSQSEIDLINMIALCNNYYFNRSTSLVSDSLYDILRNFSEIKFIKNKKKPIGAKVTGKNKVLLPYKMASLNKIKPDTNALDKWKSKYVGPYIITGKLDGISALYCARDKRLFTRGDGVEGQDISHLVPYLGLNKLNKNCVLRGELIISKNKFQTKYKNVYANARNMVAGLTNKKVNESDVVLKSMLNDIDFVVYELVEPSLVPSVQHHIISKMSEIRHVFNIELEDINNDLLSNILLNIREKYEYETDGIVVTDDEEHERSEELKNPEHAFAFKMTLTEQAAEATVVDVIWTPSKDGYMKPRVKIEPIHLCGVTIEYATGFNAGFINENKIGVGTILEIIRSGDVIPYINKVVQPSANPKMPLNLDKYVWNETKVDLILKEEFKNENIDVMEKQIAGFFKKLKVEGLSNGNVRKILNYNNESSIESIIKMNITDYMKIPGFQQTMATKISESIKNKLQSEKLTTIMAASNIFGRGFSEKRISDIMASYPEILSMTNSTNEKIDMVKSVGGISIKTATQFVINIKAFETFMSNINMAIELEDESKSDSSSKFDEELFVITGFRDETLQSYITSNGGKIGNTITKKTKVLIVKEKGLKETAKTKEANKKGIPIMTKEEFFEANK
jgi:NAD-dependent DNA ligase